MKKDKIKTAFAYAKNVFITGAFNETSRGTEVEICSKIPKVEGAVIVEYGMGHGNITREALRMMPPDATLYSFEVKPEFCEHVRKTITDPRLVIINDSAENAKQHLPPQAHAFIASIPFSFFPKEVGRGILRDAYDLLVPGGYYSQVLYAKRHYKKFVAVFDDCKKVKIPNSLPTEYVFHCRKEEGN